MVTGQGSDGVARKWCHMSKLTEYVKNEVIRHLNKSDQSIAHGFDHVERVLSSAFKIADTVEGVDYEILELAVLLHDIEQPWN